MAVFAVFSSRFPVISLDNPQRLITVQKSYYWKLKQCHNRVRSRKPFNLPQRHGICVLLILNNSSENFLHRIWTLFPSFWQHIEFKRVVNNHLNHLRCPSTNWFKTRLELHPEGTAEQASPHKIYICSRTRINCLFPSYNACPLQCATDWQ